MNGDSNYINKRWGKVWYGNYEHFAAMNPRGANTFKKYRRFLETR